MTHSSRPTLIFNSVISKITSACSLWHEGKKRDRQRETGPSRAFGARLVFFPLFFSSLRAVNIRAQGKGFKTQEWTTVWRGEKRLTAGERMVALSEAGVDWVQRRQMLKALDLTLLTPTVVAPVAPSQHTLLLLTVLSQGCPGRDKDCS